MSLINWRITSLKVSDLKFKLLLQDNTLFDSILKYIVGFTVKYFFQLIYTNYVNCLLKPYFDRHINKNLVLGNRWSKLDWNGLWAIIFQICVLQPCPPIKMVAITKNRQGGHDCMVVGFTTNCNYFLSPLKLWVRIPLIARCTWYNIMWLSLSVTYSMLVVFSGFLHQ